MGYTNYLYAQKDNYTIQGFNVSWDAENTTFVPNDNFIIPGGNAVGLPGTHLSVTTLDHASGGDDLYVFYQTEGDDISVFTRDLVAGPWAAASVDIPDS